VSATLRPVGTEEAAELMPAVENGYAVEMEQYGGFTHEAARSKAAADVAELLDDETASLFVVEAESERVGHLWVGEREGGGGRMLWIYDVFVDEELRGRGFGRDVLLLAEEEARRRGLTRVGLNVFGGNVLARALYRSLGYGEVAVVMRKDLE
jgi:ribosomal protein S18 acetylase RimI-like enzyme